MSSTRARKARTLLLCCPKCRRKQTMKHLTGEPARARYAVTWCPECVGGGFSDGIIYRDAKGREITPPAARRARRPKK
jgi:hypothetical protein